MLVLDNRLFQKEEQKTCDKSETYHYQYVVSLIEISENESGNQVSEDLRAHVESPKEGEIKSFVFFNSTI